MPRTPRVFVEGGIYHVYNRFASGEAVFADPEAARDFIELLRFVKKRARVPPLAFIAMCGPLRLTLLCLRRVALFQSPRQTRHFKKRVPLITTQQSAWRTVRCLSR